MHPPVPEMNASSPKPKASSTESGKKFCACSHVPESFSSVSGSLTPDVLYGSSQGLGELENDILYDVYVCTPNKPTHIYAYT